MRRASITVLVLWLLAGTGAGVADVPEEEPAAPEATAAVQSLLDEAQGRLDDKKPEEALPAADRALAAAGEASDGAGLGYAHRARARALEALDRNDEALAAWKEAERDWMSIGAVPEQVEALGARALMFARAADEEAVDSEVERAVLLAREEDRRPVAAARMLNTISGWIWRVGRLVAAERLAQAALEIADKHAPGSLAVAASLGGLGNVAYEQGDLATAADYHRRALKIREKHAPGSLDVAASLDGLGSVADQHGDLVAASDYHRRALEIREKHAPGSQDVAASLVSLGIVASKQGDHATAKEYFERGLAIEEGHAPGSLGVGAIFNNLGMVSWGQGDLVAAKEHFERGLAIKERHAPGSLDVAGSINNLGMVSWSQGDLAAAEDYYQRALAIQERHAPGSLVVAQSLYNLGIVAWSRGDLTTAENYYERALSVFAKTAPGSLYVAGCLYTLGVVAQDRGDALVAKDHFERSLAIWERHAPGSLDVARGLRSLGTLALDQGDVAAAKEYLKRALVIQERRAPGSLEVATTLHNLGVVATDEGDLAGAKGYYENGLAIMEKHAPGSLLVARSLNNLGVVAIYEGDLAGAKAYYENALAVIENDAPGSLAVAMNLGNLGGVAFREGDLAGAKGYYENALVIMKKTAPGSFAFAASLNSLGRVVQRLGDLDAAEEWMSRAWDIVREQRRAVVGDEAGRAFAATHAFYETDLVTVRLARGKTVSAFEALEEGRAQGLLQLLSERGLAGAGVEAELWKRFEVAEHAFETAASRLGEASTSQAALEREVAGLTSDAAAESELAAMQQELAEATKEHEEALSAYTRARLEKQRLLGEVRRKVPGLESRRFSFDEARRALPEDAVFVTFSLGEDEGAVFAIPSDPERPVTARTIPFGEAELAGRVAALRAQIGAGGILRGIGGLAEAEPNRATDAEVVAASRALSDDLFPPEAQAAIEAAERVIVSPDGPLWELPFAALVMNTFGEPTWLGLEKRLSYTPSLTVFAEEHERKTWPAAVARTALVVGDPIFMRAAEPAAAADAVEAQDAVAETTAAPSTPTSAVLRGERSYLAPGGEAPGRLPATAVEARRVAAIYGVQPLLGEAATEAAIREKLPQASVAHLASHGYFHPRLAMSSGVLLTPPASKIAVDETTDDGALQAWEFGTSLPLHADLVVLSACETGRGETVRGEGLVGLTRALQGAGARSVVATHWQVADEATAELMVRFHKLLRTGVPKDEALRRSMKKTAEQKQTRHPFYWAPFFLTGDPDRPLSLSE